MKRVNRATHMDMCIRNNAAPHIHNRLDNPYGLPTRFTRRR